MVVAADVIRGLRVGDGGPARARFPFMNESATRRSPVEMMVGYLKDFGVLKETRSFAPPPEFAAAAHVKSLAEYERLYQRAKDDPEGFWAGRAGGLPWMRPYSKVLDWNPPVAKWFVGGLTNASAACLDQHVAAGRGDKTAIVWVGEPTGERRTFTYCKPLVLSPGNTPVELNRLDTKNWSPTPAVVRQTLVERLQQLGDEVDAVVVLDQVDLAGPGVVTGPKTRAIVCGLISST